MPRRRPFACALSPATAFPSVRAGDAVPALLSVLEHDDHPSVVTAAAESLDLLDPVEGLSASLRRVGRESPETRRLGLLALGRLRSRTVEILPVLLEATGDPAERDTVAAIESLGCLGAREAGVVERLVQLSHDSESDAIVSSAVTAIGRIEIASSERFELLPSYPPEIARNGNRIVAEAVGKLAIEHPSVLRLLLDALGGDKERNVRLGAILTLRYVGNAATEALPALLKIAAGEQDPELSLDADYTIEQIR